MDLQAQFSRDFKQVDIVVDGIKSGRATDIESDSDGYLWITSFDGLLRYDGYTFTRYSHDPNNHRSIPIDQVEVLHVDKMGTLWIGTVEGLARYNRDSNDFDRFSSDSSVVPSGFIVDITDGPDSTLWIAAQEGGLYSFDPKKGVFSRHLDKGHSASLASNKLRVLLVDREGIVWIGLGFGLQAGKHGLIKYDPKHQSVKRYQHDPNDPHSLVDNRISQLMQDNMDRIFVGTYKNGLHLFDKVNDNFIRMEGHHTLSTLYPPAIDRQIWYTDPFVSILKQDSRGGYWIGTIGAGLHYFSSLTDDPILYSQNSSENSGLMTNLLWTLHEDSFNNIWVGDLGGVGIHKLDPSTPLFEKIRAPNSFMFKDFAVMHDQTLMAVDRANKIYTYDINDQWSPIDFLDQKIEIDIIHCSPATDDIWLTGREAPEDSGQITLINLSNEDLSLKFHYPPTELGNQYRYTDLTEDQYNRIWLATGTHQLHIFDPKQESFEIRSLGAERTTKIDEIFQSSGEIWLADRENRTLLKFNSITDSFSIELKGYNVKSLCTGDSTLYVGTADGLLLKRDISGNIFEMPILQGSPRSEINMLQLDMDQRLWIGSEKGLYLLDPGSSVPRFVGLRGNNFKRSIHKIANKYYANTDIGIIAFDPDDAEGNQFQPIVHISIIDVDGQRLNRASDQSDLLSFRSNNNNVTFSYIGLHSSEPLQNRYKYRLTPFDNDWITADNDHSVRYTNIPPGQYEFQLLASNRDGVWTSQPATVAFEIRPPWWLRWWSMTAFITILIVMSTSVYYLLINWKMRQLEMKRLGDLNQFKTKLYSNITHEFRTPLTVIMGLADNLKEHFQYQNREHAKSATMIYNNGEHLLHLVNKMLDFARLEDDSMTLDLMHTDIVPLVKNTVQGFHPLAREKDIILQLNDEVSHLEMEFDAQKFHIILSNLISNALKFTPKFGIVKVRIFRLDKDIDPCFCISVIDNGIGVPEQDIPKIFDRYFQAENNQLDHIAGSGIGLSLTRDLIELMGGSIEAQHSEIGGMEFTIKLPIVNNILVDEINRKSQVLNGGNGIVDSKLPLILLIEDNHDISHYITTCLDTKFQILHEADGDRGLETAFEKLPDLVITDLMLPGLQGFEILTSLKKDPRTDHIPIIILTAKVAMHDRLQGLQLGADAYLTKPFDKEELLIRIERLLEIRQKLQKKYRSHLLSSTIDVDPGSKEDHFILKAEKIILENLQDEDFSGNMLASKMHLSRSQFHRKIKALTDMSASIYIRHVRLHQALSLLKNPETSISEIAYQVGFKSPVYFSQVFKDKFDLTPSEMRESITKFS